ncbi:MAG TPA: NAD(P)(+) transhydrogenase (Re/Si-specific) subunit beta, partial [Desulfobacteraceae bacterium]|nr:NAD(P)(+) transhydrogenase (Re/Si-specific) subunit beta [Desulfobacteraceae bacterium]
MSNGAGLFIDLLIIGILIFGIRLFRTPGGARHGNLAAALALVLAVSVTLMRHGLVQAEVVLMAALVGSFAGWFVAMRVTMIQIPAMVAFQHGAGGVAAFLVALVELMRISADAAAVGRISGIIGLVIGAGTFSGSMIAGGKLAKKLSQTPVVLPRHNLVLLGTAAAAVALGGVAFGAADPAVRIALFIVLIFVSILLGIFFSMRIGGADMPVLISFLNATAGLAAAFCGVIIQNKLLIACGATVAASGSILTHVMCRAMNRSLLKVFVGLKPAAKTSAGAVPEPSSHFFQGAPREAVSEEDPSNDDDPSVRAVSALKDAGRVIVIPGYGMALAQAQFKVLELMNLLEEAGKTVKFAIHPVAGRMPGHMNVLLAEADIPYDKLFEMDEINGEFPDTDVAMV